MDARANRSIAAIDTTSALPAGVALALMGRYQSAKTACDLEEYENRLFLVPARGGSRAELRRPAPAGDSELIADDALSYGTHVRVLDDARIVVDADTLRRVPRPAPRFRLRNPSRRPRRSSSFR